MRQRMQLLVQEKRLRGRVQARISSYPERPGKTQAGRTLFWTAVKPLREALEAGTPEECQAASRAAEETLLKFAYQPDFPDKAQTEAVAEEAGPSHNGTHGSRGQGRKRPWF